SATRCSSPSHPVRSSAGPERSRPGSATGALPRPGRPGRAWCRGRRLRDGSWRGLPNGAPQECCGRCIGWPMTAEVDLHLTVPFVRSFGWSGGHCQVPCTVVGAVPLSSVSAGTLLAVAFAASLTVPSVVAVTLMVTVMLAPAARLAAVQETVPPLVACAALGVRVHLPAVTDAASKWAVAGRVSVTVTPVAF